MTEAELRKALVDISRKHIGFSEADDSHRLIIDLYNSKRPLPRGYAVQYTDQWCATFVSAMSILCGLTAIIPRECSCEEQIRLFQRMGRWREDENYIPKPGDIVYYEWSDGADYASTDNRKWADHVGIVSQVSGGCITVIEGNLHNRVGERKIMVNGRYLRGYGVPDYASLATTEDEENDNREDDDMVRYNKVSEMPEWYRKEAQRLVDRGALAGRGDGNLDVSEDMIRTLIICQRMIDE